MPSLDLTGADPEVVRELRQAETTSANPGIANTHWLAVRDVHRVGSIHPMRHLIAPVISTLVGVAVTVGGYQSRLLADVVWVVCGLLWILWLVTSIEWRYVSPEERQVRKQFQHYETLGDFITGGETILLKMSRAPEYGPTDLRGEMNRWAAQCKTYLAAEYSQASANTFCGFYLADANNVAQVIKQMNARLDYLRTLRHDVYVSTRGQ